MYVKFKMGNKLKFAIWHEIMIEIRLLFVIWYKIIASMQ